MVWECLNPDANCGWRGRKSIGHHEYYPKRDYQTELERAFRNLGCNITQRCVCIEAADPHTTPLAKPSVHEMCLALTVEF